VAHGHRLDYDGWMTVMGDDIKLITARRESFHNRR